jgi:hypothetical protein
VDDRRQRRAPRAARAPHRRRARVGLRPDVPHRPARPGARRGAGEGLDGRRHEEGLEDRLPIEKK